MTERKNVTQHTLNQKMEILVQIKSNAYKEDIITSGVSRCSGV